MTIKSLSNPRSSSRGTKSLTQKAERKTQKQSENVENVTSSTGGRSRAERKDQGKSLRAATPIESLAKVTIVKSGRDIIKILEKSNKGRVPELIPLRYGRMLVSPFTFFRGSAGIQAFDLSHDPKSGIIVQACGDCHIQNFGAFATPERRIVVDINDFDETLPAPWEWDIKRLAASLVLAATSNGYSPEFGQEAASRMAAGYREHMAQLSNMSPLQQWYSSVDYEELLGLVQRERKQKMEGTLKEAMEKSSPEVMLQKLTVMTEGKMRFRDVPPLLCHQEGVTMNEEIKHCFAEYRRTLPEDRQILLDRFQPVDIARKVVGIGSVGTICGVLLLVGTETDNLVLQVKEARESVLEPYAGASKYSHHGQRVVMGQKLMQAASDLFLGWTTGRKPELKHFYLRQLKDVKVGVNTVLWTKEDFKLFPRIAGEILARAHARSSDATILRGYLGKNSTFDEAIAEYAASYANQVVRDYQQFVRACKTGVLKFQTIDS